MDGENNGIYPIQMDDLGGFHPLFSGNIPSDAKKNSVNFPSFFQISSHAVIFEKPYLLLSGDKQDQSSIGHQQFCNIWKTWWRLWNWR